MHYEISLGDSKNVRFSLTNYNKVEIPIFCSIYRFYSSNLFISRDEFFNHSNPKSCGIDCQCDTVAVKEYALTGYDSYRMSHTVFYLRHFPIFSNSLNIWQSVFEILLTRFSPSEFDSFRTESILDNVSWSSRGGLSVDVPSEIVTTLSPFCVSMSWPSRVTLVRSRSVTHWLVFSESVAVSRVTVTLSHVVSRVVSIVVSPVSLSKVVDSVVHLILSSKSFIVDSANVVISRSVSDEFLLSDVDLKAKGHVGSCGVMWGRIPTVKLKIPEKHFWNPNPELLLHSSYSFWP